MIHEERLEILLLCNEQQKKDLPSEFLLDHLHIRTDAEVLNELLIRKYDTVIITKPYVDIYGEDKVGQAVTLLNVATTSRIHYIINPNSLTVGDKIISKMNALGLGNITKIDITKIPYDDFRNISTMQNEASIINLESKVDKNKLLLIKKDIQLMTDDLVGDYLVENKTTVLDALNLLMNKMEENVNMEIEIQDLKDERNLLKSFNSELVINNNNLIGQEVIYKEQLKDLKRLTLTESDKIKDYNEAVKDNPIIDFPIVDLGTTAPLVIYFKELEDIGFLSMYEAISYTLREVYKISTKSIILEPTSRTYFDPYTNMGYILGSNDILIKDLIDNDKIVRYGNPTNLLKNLSNPEFRVEVILVFDRTQTEDILVETDTLIPLYIGYTRDNIATLEIEDTSWLSPIEGNWKNIKPLLRQSLVKKEDRIAYYAHASKHPLTEFCKEIATLR